MHDSVYAWVKSIAPTLESPTLEVGSTNVNGTVRGLFAGDYVGIDIVAGPGVDRVYDGNRIPFDTATFATVLCLEVLEHALRPWKVCAEIARVLRPGGTALVSARGNGFPLHHEPDRWRFMGGTIPGLFPGCETTEIADPQPEHPGWLVTVRR